MKWLGDLMLKINGWKVENKIDPKLKKYVLIAAPHTSNIDFFLALYVMWSIKLKANYLIKKEWFRWPLGGFFRWTGGIPVDRTNNTQQFVEDLTTSLKSKEDSGLLFTPEGTRSRVVKWKTGFYRIAIALKLPIMLAYADYEKKKVCIGELYYPTGDLEKDLEELEGFYTDVKAKFPEKFNHQFFEREN